jgi:hypothetical protein
MSAARKVRRGRPPIDPRAPAPPTLSIAAAVERYRIGRDQISSAVKAKEIPFIMLNGRPRIIRSKADEMFGLA